jgi:hypothetical protein
MFSLRKVFATWAAMVTICFLSLALPHEQVLFSGLLNNSIQMLLFVTCLYIVTNEPTRRNKFVFANLAAAFGFSILFHLYNFIPSGSFLRLFYFQYVGGAYQLTLTFAIAYLTIDFLFVNRLSTALKYSITLVIIGGFFVFYFYSFIVNPHHVYESPDVRDYAVLEKEFVDYQQKFGVPPTPAILASRIVLPEWVDGVSSGVLERTQLVKRVSELYPYLVGGNNYGVLIVRPFYVNIIYMCVVALGFVLLFFGYQYLKDPPQGAYIEKIMFLILVFCTMEILHAWSFVKSIEWQSFYEIMSIGQVISMVILLLIGVFFLLRLKFITSPKGVFYEKEIVSSPAGITRWRDMLDDLVLEHFLSGRQVGRLFVDRHGS